MNESGEIKEGEEKKKRGRKTKNEEAGYKINKEQTKFIVDLEGDEKLREKVFSLLEAANNKAYGREITFRDLAMHALSKMTEKDVEKIQETSLTEMERVQKHLDEFNQKNNTNLGLGEFLVKKLGI